VCGALVAAPRPQPAPPVAELQYDRETLRFARSVLTRPYIFTIILLIANFFVFLLMWKSSGLTFESLWAFPGQVLVAYGAKMNILIDQHPHQWWRFVTPMFLHGSLIHVLVNMYSLWMIGPYVEKLYGSAKFVVFWVVTGVMGVVASYLSVVHTDHPLGPFAKFIFKTQDGPSVGASGALFGLVGVLFVFGIKFRHELPEGFKRAFGTGLLPVILLNLFIGFMGQRIIDNAAHLGGLLSGAALALVVGYRRPGEATGMQTFWRVLQITSLALVVVSFARVVQNFGTEPLALTPPNTAQPKNVAQPKNAATLNFAKAMTDGQEAFESARHGNLDGLDNAVKALGAVEGPDFTSEQLRHRLQQLLQQVKEAPPIPSPVPGKSKTVATNTIDADFASLKKEYEQWLKTGAKEHLQLSLDMLPV
jgi:rhomboid protease GluP